jgi:hypothetical protein
MIEENFVPRTFGKWTTLGPAFKKRIGKLNKWHVTCRCECGNEKDIVLYKLEKGTSTRCRGCAQTKTGWQTGKSSSNPLIRSAAVSRRSMLQRCYDPTFGSYCRYGAKGVKVTELGWLDPIHGFNNFLKDMGLPPAVGFQIERIDSKKNYYKENCCWATPKEQQNNRSNNHKITWNGETKNLGQWAQLQGIAHYTLWYRLVKLKWPVDKALSTPVQKRVK